ncbi:MAG: hypothetical protein JXA03_15775 [Bacteroidales bacterium]|nr:hypothetical protein [Bacteroidales bacterium]
MKTAIKTLVITALISFPLTILAQNPPHPNGGNAPGSGNTPVGGGSPLGGGLVVLMTLAAGYATRKVFFMRKEK